MALCPACANPHTSELLQKKTDVDFVSSKCLECSETADSFEFLLLAHAIKTNVGCASTSSKCTYVLNANSKGPGETGHLRKCAESSELLLLAYATRTHSMARHRKSPRSRRNLMVIEGHQFDRR